jgi:HAE1 family hydrophobic/amphiphilic exporter-1
MVGMRLLTRRYRRALRFCLDRRWTVLLAAFAIFAVSLLGARGLRREFLPPQDQSRFMVTLHTPMGSSLAFTDGVFREAERFLASRPEVESSYVAVGGFGGGLVSQGIIFVNLRDPRRRPVVPPFTRRPTQQELMALARERLSALPGVDRVSVLDLSLVGFSAQRGYPIEFELQGPDWDTLTRLARELKTRLAASGRMTDVDTDYNPDMPEIVITPDRGAAGRHGVTIDTITRTIAAMVGGLRLLPNKYTDSSGHRDDIQVKLVSDENQTPADIEKIQVRTIPGEIIPIRKVVRLRPHRTLLTITRFNRERAIGFFGNFPPGQSQSVVLDHIQKTARELLPPGYFITLSGSSQAFGESFQGLFWALILGIFVAYMVLASQFNSFLHPWIILLALPFSVTGAIAALRLTDTSLNIYSLIGILLLMGIVKKNSILLVDFTNARRRAGMGVREALLEACPIRLRPILMTSTAMIAGAIPEAAALGPGAEIIRPMAITVIGGVLFSTALTLFVVPCAYSLCARLEGARHRRELQEALVALGELPARPGSPPEKRSA